MRTDIMKAAFEDELQKIAKEVETRVPTGGFKSGLLKNEAMLDSMTPEDRELVEKLPWYKKTGPGLIPLGVANGLAHSSLGYSLAGKKGAAIGALTGGIGMPLLGHALQRSGVFDKKIQEGAKNLVLKTRAEEAEGKLKKAAAHIRSGRRPLKASTLLDKEKDGAGEARKKLADLTKLSGKSDVASRLVPDAKTLGLLGIGAYGMHRLQKMNRRYQTGRQIELQQQQGYGY